MLFSPFSTRGSPPMGERIDTDAMRKFFRWNTADCVQGQRIKERGIALCDEVDRLAELEQALRAIEKDEIPCVTCGRAHLLRSPKTLATYGGMRLQAQTWADPDDGHPYRRRGIREFVAAVLDKGEPDER